MINTTQVLFPCLIFVVDVGTVKFSQSTVPFVHLYTLVYKINDHQILLAPGLSQTFQSCNLYCPQLFYVVATSYQTQCKTADMLKQRGMDIYWTFLLDSAVCVCVWCVCVCACVCVCVCVCDVIFHYLQPLHIEVEEGMKARLCKLILTLPLTTHPSPFTPSSPHTQPPSSSFTFAFFPHTLTPHSSLYLTPSLLTPPSSPSHPHSSLLYLTLSHPHSSLLYLTPSHPHSSLLYLTSSLLTPPSSPSHPHTLTPPPPSSPLLPFLSSLISSLSSLPPSFHRPSPFFTSPHPLTLHSKNTGDRRQ